MRRVVLESPYRGKNFFQRWRNIRYARAAVRDSVLRGESPLCSHLLYTQPGILDDTDPHERKMGIDAGHAWLGAADAMVVYTNRGITEGMRTGIKRGVALGIPVEYRRLW